jgi:DNA-binding XRE family transcriptional regulator
MREERCKSVTSMNDAHRRSLQRLLVTARGRIDPEELGLARTRDPRGMKVPGLTQAQVARALGCSTETYSRFERDRGSTPSSEFLQRLAEILSLNEYQWRELWLAAVGHGPPWSLHPDTGSSAPDLWRQAVHQLETMAFLGTAAWEVLESNAAFARMFPDGKPPANVLRWMLLEEEAREVVLRDWEHQWCPALISQLITARAAHPHNPALEKLDADVRADALAGRIYREDTEAFLHPNPELPLQHATLGHGWARMAPAEPLDSPGARITLIGFRAAPEPPMPPHP